MWDLSVLALSGAFSAAEQLSEDAVVLLFLREQVYFRHIGALNYIFDGIVKNTKWEIDNQKTADVCV